MKNSKNNKSESKKSLAIATVAASLFVSLVFGTLAGFSGAEISKKNNFRIAPIINNQNEKVNFISDKKTKIIKEESGIIDAVQKVNPAVVSIIVTKDIPKMERYYVDPFENDSFDDFFNFPNFRTPEEKQNGTEKREVGG